MNADKKLNELFHLLVPIEGKSSTVAGEIVRAVSRIVYRNSNDGDHIGVGYGKETCNPAARYLMSRAGAEVRKTIVDLWGIINDDAYGAIVSTLEAQVIKYLDNHPDLLDQENTEDMWEFRIPEEDRDDDDREFDEDDWCEDEE